MSADLPSSDPEPLCDEALLLAYGQGDQAAAEAIFQRYYDRLVSLARSEMGYMLRQVEESADVAQSVFDSVFQRGRNNQIRLSPQDSLWPLLVTITVHKIRNHAKFQTRQKRDQRRNVPVIEPDLLDARAIPEHVVQTKELILELHKTFGPRRRDVIDGLLNGLSVAQIAQQTGLAERTVYKTRQGIKQILEQILTEGE